MTTNNTENAGGDAAEELAFDLYPGKAAKAVTELLKDPTSVHVNMLRGGIAKPSPASIWHIYGKELFDAMPDEFRIAARQAALEEVRAELPDEIDLFRAIRDAGGKNSDKAKAAYALIPPALRFSTKEVEG